MVSHSKVMNDDDVSRQIVVESPYDTAVTSCTGQEGLATSPSSSQLTCPRRQICLMSHFTRSASWPLTSPNPGFWGQCQVPEDYVKCAHVSCQRGGSGAAFLTFLGQCQTSPPLPHKYQHANQCSRRRTGRAPIFRIKIPGSFRHLRNS